jgi:EAL domain-containing protein (putative c-di-GMP-specific phosphodiesterase class I)
MINDPVEDSPGGPSRYPTPPAASPAHPIFVAPDVFIVDDEVGVCKVVSMALSSLGLVSESYHTAQQAIAALERGHPDIIFLDISLKGSDAVEVIRALGEKRYVGLVQLMSGSNSSLLEDVRRVGARHGLNMRPPLSKPFRMEAIRRAVASTPFDGQAETELAMVPSVRLNLDEVIANDWFELWYQPKIDLRTNRLAGAEGLIRCRHPVYGIVSPDGFLPGASEASLSKLTEHVVVAALRDWEEAAEAGVYLRAAVNATVGSLGNPALANLIREHRPRNENWPGLILEVTESEVIKDVGFAHEMATQLRIYGITLAIDDFGEGYSSLARLRELPFAELKLDRSFVEGCADDAGNAAICHAVIELAHRFGAVAVAEGLEAAEDLEAVRNMGCDIGQGFVLARPMPKPHFIALLRERTLPWQTASAA